MTEAFTKRLHILLDYIGFKYLMILNTKRLYYKIHLVHVGYFVVFTGAHTDVIFQDLLCVL